MSAHASSTAGSAALDVPHTVMPSEDAAPRSMAAFLMPVVTSNRSRGKRDSTAAGNGVRSRMATTMSKGSSAATTVSGRSEMLVEHLDVDTAADRSPIARTTAPPAR